MNIMKEKKEELLSRSIYELEIEHIGKPTPKEENLLNEVAQLLKKEKECIVIKHIYTKQGHPVSKIICYSYLNKDLKDKIEGKKKENKENGQKESKK
ncbi:MAG: hypothetical protein V1663_01510 [archaeon]